MVDAKEFIELETSTLEKQKEFRLAAVVELFENGTAKIKFRGEEIPSEKEYSYLSSYVPQVFDDVLLAPLLDTYIILGKIKFKEGQNEESFVTSEEIENILTGYIKTEDLETNLGEYAKKTDLDSYLKLESNGQFELGDTGYYNELYSLEIKKNFKHTGSNIGFFGSSPTSKNSVSTLSSSATLDQVISRFNTLVNALDGYGLV